MGNNISIRRGYDIRLQGAAEKTLSDIPVSDVVAIKPPDFRAVIPKMMVEPGDEVLAGQPLFFDKNRPNIRYASPVSGEVADIVRGEKRRIMEVRILADKGGMRYVEFPKEDPEALHREQIIDRLLESGCWNYIRQRPYSTVADPESLPKAIFVSCFDSAPLAPDLDYIKDMEPEHLKAGIAALSKLSDGKVHLGLKPGQQEGDFPGTHTVNHHFFSGPHPAGNVGIQIHHIDPIAKGETVWYVHLQDLLIIGRLFLEGRYRADRVVALTGSCMLKPQYVRVMTGSKLGDFLSGQMTSDHARVIQGNVLTGRRSSGDDFLSYYTNQITAIPEGDQPEFMGWLLPGLQKLSLSRTYFSWLFPKRKYDLNTNMHGERRAFVMTGQYDKVLPMNIYPVHLLKAILAKDIERMEQLGIYEVSEEDFALCEFVCTSKIDVQQIVSEGLEYVRLEG
ncbi:MAG: Na(+)-translocating NADH-quinone reductase subunit A [Lewinellaceae bacterium]|nr:Na(+)-translocating NADH-quinone reductase subunit A [Saprospiraceae bacterium]MCB0543694.1 Na(+)-translocating NADH-quinone reductase subunit A [Saprospiraceae bacterium]MCB9353850.1 Na(+)-translocating NADH-quinone reductase subunit A [Lewinellaceae bacterium]